MSAGCVLKPILHARACHTQAQLSAEVSNCWTATCMFRYFVLKNLFKKGEVVLGLQGRYIRSGRSDVCSVGVTYLLPRSQAICATKPGNQRSPLGRFSLWGRHIQHVNIMLSKDFPSKRMVIIYCHGRQIQQQGNLSWFHYMQWSNWH